MPVRTPTVQPFASSPRRAAAAPGRRAGPLFRVPFRVPFGVAFGVPRGIPFGLPWARRSMGLACVCLALAGCTGWQRRAEPPPAPAPAAAAPVPVPAPPPPAAPDPAAEADAATRRALAFAERVRELGTADLARELARLGDAPADPAAAVELALVLAQTRQPGDLARAVAALEPLTRPAAAPAATPWQPVARLLHARLSEQRRQEEQIERLAQTLRDQQRRIDQLSSQLDALRAIERSLATRPVAPPASAPSRTP